VENRWAAVFHSVVGGTLSNNKTSTFQEFACRLRRYREDREEQFLVEQLVWTGWRWAFVRNPKLIEIRIISNAVKTPRCGED
jgi:hypothetical protein